jgi:hypothetical protein
MIFQSGWRRPNEGGKIAAVVLDPWTLLERGLELVALGQLACQSVRAFKHHRLFKKTWSQRVATRRLHYIHGDLPGWSDPAPVITTNFDRLLEDAFKKA